MTTDQKDTLTVRVTSTGFAIVVFALFKPLGLEYLGWKVYLHLLAIWVLGIGVCYVTEAILRYLLRMPASFDKGAEYIIRRNLWFQIINTPLMALLCCIYFHFPLSALHASLPSPLSWQGYLTMLLIVAFCSFTIGLYWRIKFRSRFLAAELEETKKLNEVIKQSGNQATVPSSSQAITLTGNTSESIALSVSDLLYLESVGNYVKIYHLRDGKVVGDMLRATSKQMEASLQGYPSVIRCHRAFIVNISQVENVVSLSGTMQLVMKHTHDILPVSRTYSTQVKSVLTNLKP